MDLEPSDMRFKDWILEKYDHGTTCFLKWLNSFEYMCEILNKRDDEKVNCLLNMIIPSDFEVTKEGLSHIHDLNLPYNKIVALLTEIYTNCLENEVPNIRFTSRIQLPYETIKHYDIALRVLLSKCTPAFKSSVSLTNVFVEGLADEEIKTYFEKHEEISISMLVHKAEQMELSKNQKSGESSSK